MSSSVSTTASRRKAATSSASSLPLDDNSSSSRVTQRSPLSPSRHSTVSVNQRSSRRSSTTARASSPSPKSSVVAAQQSSASLPSRSRAEVVHSQSSEEENNQLLLQSPSSVSTDNVVDPQILSNVQALIDDMYQNHGMMSSSSSQKTKRNNKPTTTTTMTTTTLHLVPSVDSGGVADDTTPTTPSELVVQPDVLASLERYIDTLPYHPTYNNNGDNGKLSAGPLSSHGSSSRDGVVSRGGGAHSSIADAGTADLTSVDSETSDGVVSPEMLALVRQFIEHLPSPPQYHDDDEHHDRSIPPLDTMVPVDPDTMAAVEACIELVTKGGDRSVQEWGLADPTTSIVATATLMESATLSSGGTTTSRSMPSQAAASVGIPTAATTPSVTSNSRRSDTHRSTTAASTGTAAASTTSPPVSARLPVSSSIAADSIPSQSYSTIAKSVTTTTSQGNAIAATPQDNVEEEENDVVETTTGVGGSVITSSTSSRVSAQGYANQLLSRVSSYHSEGKVSVASRRKDLFLAPSFRSYGQVSSSSRSVAYTARAPSLASAARGTESTDAHASREEGTKLVIERIATAPTTASEAPSTDARREDIDATEHPSSEVARLRNRTN